MDDYLRAVVPAEMPAVWPIEALRAQAVAARSYAYLRLKPRNTFDVRPTSANQVYAGWKRGIMPIGSSSEPSRMEFVSLVGMSAKRRR